MRYKKGDKVRILRKDITNLLCPYGVVTRQDGGYVYVKPIWQSHEIELYDTEIEIATPFWEGVDKERKKQIQRVIELVDECVGRYKHLDNCPYTKVHLNGLIRDVAIYALYKQEKQWY